MESLARWVPFKAVEGPDGGEVPFGGAKCSGKPRASRHRFSVA
jgi:hypothetical protein